MTTMGKITADKGRSGSFLIAAQPTVPSLFVGQTVDFQQKTGLFDRIRSNT